jgi:hypothetical protein
LSPPSNEPNDRSKTDDGRDHYQRRRSVGAEYSLILVRMDRIAAPKAW